MLSVSKPMIAAQAQQYFKKDDYYLQEKGHWHGKGARALGLFGVVNGKDFKNITEGRNPAGNELITEGANGTRRAGCDFTFSAPKSVSILSIADGRIAERQTAAVRNTLDYIERNYTQARVSSKGVTAPVDTHNMVIALFEHMTNRELDIQRHTHAFICNMTRRPDGKWRAIHNDEIYRNKKFFGQYYRNILALEMQKLGYQIEITDGKNGFFEIKGVSKKLMAEMSGRREQVVKLAEKWIEEVKYPGLSKGEIYEKAALESRGAKQKNVSKKHLRKRWDKTAADAGTTFKKERENALHEAEKNRHHQRKRIPATDIISLAADGITENESVFTRETILKDAMKLGLGHYNAAQLESAMDRLIKSGRLVTLDRNIYTTSEMQKIEKNILTQSKKGLNTQKSILTSEQAERKIENLYPHLTGSQRKAFTHIMTSQDQIIGLQGDAGTGKTTMLFSAKEQLERAGYAVQGLTFTGNAASELEHTSGIPSRTVQSFLSKPIDEHNKQLFIIDEASMIGSRQLFDVMKTIKSVNGKIVLVGDTKQMQSISAGNVFSALMKSGSMQTVTLTEIVRQKDEEYKKIVEDIARKKIEAAFTKMEKKNIIHQESNINVLKEKIVRDYLAGDYKKSLIITELNSERQGLNELIRPILRDRGILEKEEHTVTIREAKNLQGNQKRFAHNYQPGQILTVNKNIPGLKSGTEGKILSTALDSQSVTIQTKRGEKTINLVQDGGHVSSYDESEKTFSNNDRIVFLKNNSAIETNEGRKIKNGMTGTIRTIKKNGNILVEMDQKSKKGKSTYVKFNSGRYKYFDHGYAITTPKSQGKTTDKVLLFESLNSVRVSHNKFYVGASRGKDELKVYTTDIDVLKLHASESEIKRMTTDYEKRNKQREIKKETSEINIPRELRNAGKVLAENGKSLKRLDNYQLFEVLDHYQKLEKKEFDKSFDNADDKTSGIVKGTEEFNTFANVASLINEIFSERGVNLEAMSDEKFRIESVDSDKEIDSEIDYKKEIEPEKEFEFEYSPLG